MKHTLALAMLAALGPFLLIGCSTGTTNPSTTSVTPATPPLKATLEGVASSGQIGSAAPELQSQFEALKASDSAKADAIASDMDALLKADGNPAKVKQLASQMAGKL